MTSLLVVVAIAAGLGFPAIAALFAPYIYIALFFVVVFSLNTHDQHPLRVMRSVDGTAMRLVLWQMLVVPATVTGLCVLLDAPRIISAMLLATTAAGSVFASPALCSMVGLNKALAMRTMVLSTLIMPVSLLVFGQLIGVLPGRLSLQSYATHIFIYLIVPLAIATVYWTIRNHLPARLRDIGNASMQAGSTLSLMVFCAGVMSVIHVSENLMLEQMLSFAALAALVALMLFSISAMVFSYFGPDLAVSAGMLCANRNVALSFALLSDVFSTEVMVYVAMAQFPIFLTPLIINAGRLIRETGASRL